MQSLGEEMRIDRIFAEILNWVNHFVWWNNQKVKKPFERIQVIRLEGRGLLYLVDRDKKLSPRDVGTFFFIPFRFNDKENWDDIHICCDHLEGLGDPEGFTHRITILKASHFPEKDGRYNCELLFEGDYDLQGNQTRRDLYVRCVLERVARMAATQADLDWQYLIDRAMHHCMSSDYAKKKRVSRDAIALPYDSGTKPLRIKHSE